METLIDRSVMEAARPSWTFYPWPLPRGDGASLMDVLLPARTLSELGANPGLMPTRATTARSYAVRGGATPDVLSNRRASAGTVSSRSRRRCAIHLDT